MPTFAAQLRWLRQEQRTCQRILTEGLRSGFGSDIQEKAREDLVILASLITTLEGRQLAFSFGKEV